MKKALFLVGKGFVEPKNYWYTDCPICYQKFYAGKEPSRIVSPNWQLVSPSQLIINNTKKTYSVWVCSDICAEIVILQSI